MQSTAATDYPVHVRGYSVVVLCSFNKIVRIQHYIKILCPYIENALKRTEVVTLSKQKKEAVLFSHSSTMMKCTASASASAAVHYQEVLQALAKALPFVEFINVSDFQDLIALHNTMRVFVPVEKLMELKRAFCTCCNTVQTEEGGCCVFPFEYNDEMYCERISLCSGTLPRSTAGIGKSIAIPIIGDPKYGIKTNRECFENIIKHSPTSPALKLDLLDNLISKEVQRISNIKRTNGKMPLKKSVLAAIKGCNTVQTEEGGCCVFPFEYNDEMYCERISLCSGTLPRSTAGIGKSIAIPIIGDPKYGIKTNRECFDNIIKHSPTSPALKLNLLDNLISKEVQRISNIKRTNGKMPLKKSVLAAIKGKNDHSSTLEVPSVYSLITEGSTMSVTGAGMGLGVAGGARGWVVARAGFRGVLATWVWGRQLLSPNSLAPNLHVRRRDSSVDRVKSPILPFVARGLVYLCSVVTPSKQKKEAVVFCHSSTMMKCTVSTSASVAPSDTVAEHYQVLQALAKALPFLEFINVSDFQQLIALHSTMRVIVSAEKLMELKGEFCACH
ncbi:hypothetical protein ACROYT_G004751 [Oculina patagonica]